MFFIRKRNYRKSTINSTLDEFYFESDLGSENAVSVLDFLTRNNFGTLIEETT